MGFRMQSGIAGAEKGPVPTLRVGGNPVFCSTVGMSKTKITDGITFFCGGAAHFVVFLRFQQRL